MPTGPAAPRERLARASPSNRCEIPMPPASTHTVLQHARELLSRPAHFVPLCDAHDVAGFPVDFADPSATRWSDLGAIRHAAYRLGAARRDPRSVWPAIEAAEAALERAYERIDAMLGTARQPQTDRDAYLAALYAFELAIADQAPRGTLAATAQQPSPPGVPTRGHAN